MARLLMSQVLARAQGTVAASATKVIDVRLSRGFVVHLNGATVTARPCDADGNLVTGTSAATLVDHALNDPDWSHYKLSCTGATATYCVV